MLQTVDVGERSLERYRGIVPDSMMQDVVNALKGRLAGVKIGDPAIEGVKMGPLAGAPQVRGLQTSGFTTGELADVERNNALRLLGK